jgi:hypothetical protein
MKKMILSRAKFDNVFDGWILAIVLMLWFLASIPVYSQAVGGSLSGMITDVSGAAVPNAIVSIANVATGVTTNAQGIYNAPNLLPGSYQVTVSAPGFQTAIASGVILTVGPNKS